MTVTEEKDHKSIFKEWLEKLQQESWQLELLISGFAIFGIYQARTLIPDFDFARNGYLDDAGAWLGMLVFIFKKGWLIFFLNLLIHVVLRGLWIGAIGLRYVSQDIDYDSFRYSDIFTRFLKKSVGSYDDFIERLEKVCSIIFAYTFLLFLLFMSFMFFFMQVIFIAQLIQKLNPGDSDVQFISGLFAIIYFMFGSIVFFDLITMGGFKKVKNKFFSTIYFYIYRFFGFVTLSFFYRPLLYNFIDNNYTKKLFYLSIPYITIVAFGETMIVNIPNPYKPDRNFLLSRGQMLDENLYDDLRIIRLSEFPNEERKMNKKFLSWISMEQYEITKSVSSFFIKMDRNLMRFMEKSDSISPYFKSGYSFAWFNFYKVTDPQLQKLETAKADTLKALYAQRRKINKLLKENKDSTLVTQLDEIKSKLETLDTKFENDITKYNTEKADRIKKRYLEGFSFYMDNQKIELMQTYYYNHPHYGEEGLKCFFNTDSLTKGLHEFKIVRIIPSQSTETKDSILLPIIKM